MKPNIYTEDAHKIKQEHIDQDALEVLFKLKQAGHTAYLVGGGVRDLLLGMRPKDFDISTSAKPEEVKKIFQRRCLLIGKRFRLAHVRSGSSVLEVSTFRAGDPEVSSLIVRDNLWGSPAEDVLRRDFTINALYYDPTTHAVFDYVGGYHDLQERLIRSIGDPHTRFKQDPVRMIRLLKFRARLGFTIDPKCMHAMETCKEEIIKSAPARLLEEMFRMLESGYSEPFFTLLHEQDFLEILFPCFHHFFSGPNKTLAHKYLQSVDALQREQGKALDRAVLLSSLVFPILEQECQTLMHDRQMPLEYSDITHLSYALIRGITTSSFAQFPKKLVAICHFINSLQYRLVPLKGKPRFSKRLMTHTDFPLALTLLKIRANVFGELADYYHEWKEAVSQ